MKYSKISSDSQNSMSLTTSQIPRKSVSFSQQMLLLSLLLINVSFGRIGTQTSYDGQMYNYNSYLRFGGQSGLYYEEPQTSDLSQYSASIWVRTSTKPDDVSRGLSIFSLKPGFQCFFNIRFRVQCNSDSSSSNLQTEGAVRMNNWYVLTLRSKSSQTLIQIETSKPLYYFD